MTGGVFEEIRVSRENRACATCGTNGIRRSDPYLRLAVAPWAYPADQSTGRWDVLTFCHVCGSQRHGRAVVAAA